MEVQNEDDSNVDIDEIIKFLEDANVIEPNMTKELMMSYYKALKNSESTASEEDQTRKLNESQEELQDLLCDNEADAENVKKSAGVHNKEKPFTPKTTTSDRKVSLEVLEHNNNESLVADNILDEIINESPKDATKTAFGFNEMMKDSERTLAVITHRMKFVPIQSSTKFLKAGTALKTRMLYAYHTKINQVKSKLARLSYYPAPLPKTSSTSVTLSASFSESDFPETYVCRSGRQTKRKIYNYDDDEDSMDNTNYKKVKNSEEQEWFKSTPNKTTPKSQKKQETKVNTEINKTESEVADASIEKKAVPKKERTTSLKKLSNTEIMNRSSIFADRPKRRCEAMFDKLKEEEEKKEKEEKSMELFNKTLEAIDEENGDVTTKEDIITVDDDEPIRKRVIPPIPRQKFINRKRSDSQGVAPLDVTIKSVQNKSPTIEQNGLNQEKELKLTSKSYAKKRPAIRRMPSLEPEEPLPSTSRVSKTSPSNYVPCPICNKEFEPHKILGHAATCGDEPITRSSSKISRITCDICDEVVDFNTNFEVHVKNCIAKKKDKD